MEEYQQLVNTLALTMGASWASGINLYAAVAVLGFSAASGNIVLPPELHVLQNPLVIGAAVLMYVVEFFADKIPGFDTAWDGIHTFIRIPAGAMLAAGAVGDVGSGMAIAAGLLGGGLATASHAAKAGSRALINTSPEPFSNWAASITEDVAVIGGVWAALHHPVVFLVLLFVFIILTIWLLPRIWGALKGIFRFIGKLFGVSSEQPASATGPALNLDGGDPLERLERLKELLDAGVLTEEEFAEQKRKLL